MGMFGFAPRSVSTAWVRPSSVSGNIGKTVRTVLMVGAPQTRSDSGLSQTEAGQRWLEALQPLDRDAVASAAQLIGHPGIQQKGIHHGGVSLSQL